MGKKSKKKHNEDLRIVLLEDPLLKLQASPDTTRPIQMSLRLATDVYAEFRVLCHDQRRTNGQMLEKLLRHYKAQTLGSKERN